MEAHVSSTCSSEDDWWRVMCQGVLKSRSFAPLCAPLRNGYLTMTPRHRHTNNGYHY